MLAHSRLRGWSTPLIAALALSWFPLRSEAQSERVDLDRLLHELPAASPRVAAARTRIAASQAARRAAGRPEDPMLDIEADNLGLKSEDDRMMVRYALQQRLPTVGMLPLERKVASAMLEQTEQEAESVRLDVALAATRAFVMLRMTEGELSINERQQRAVELISESALARMRAGADAHHDVLQSQAELLSLQNQRLGLEARRIEARAMINALLNRAPDAPFEAGEPWPHGDAPLASATLETAAIARRPELKQMEAMQREQRAMSELMRREARPMFRVGVWYNDMLMMSDSVGVMLSASLPVFGVPRQRARAEASARAADAVVQDAAAMLAMIRAETKSAVARYEAAAQRERLLRDVLVKKAEEALAQAQSSYRSGMMAYASVVQDRRMVAELQMELIQAEADRTLAMAELLRAVGASSPKELAP